MSHLQRGTPTPDAAAAERRAREACAQPLPGESAEWLHERGEPLSLLLGSLAQAVWEADAAGCLVEDSPSWRRFSGQSFEEASGSGWLDAVHPEDRALALGRWREALQRGVPLDAEHRIRRGDAYRWTNVRAIPVRDERGRVLRWLGMNIDVHERRSAQEAVRASEERFRTLFESIDEGYLLADVIRDAEGHAVDLQFVEGNPAASRITGVPAFAGHRLLEIDPACDLGCLDVADRVVRTGVGERLQRRAETAGQWFDFRVSRVGGPGSLRVAVVFQDISARRRAEDELRAADRRKDEFLATLAHELRNPLAPIRNGLQIARLSARDDPRLHRVVAMMDRQVAHLVRLVDDLLDVGRISAGKIQLRRGPVRLADALAASVESTRVAVEQHGHSLEVAMPPPQLYVDGDLDRLAQVFSNLLSNAAKYTDRGGSIRVGWAVDGRDVTVHVEDDGIGIPVDELPHVFDLFSQVRVHQGRSEGGLGIGLALVRSLVEMHDGDVRVDSAGSGRGARFSVRLPLVADGAGAVEPGGALEPAADERRVRILVADDNTDALETLAELLRLAGHDVAVAGDGATAVERLREVRPDLVILDLGMPRVDGLQAARAIRSSAEGRDVTLVALTGWDQPLDRERSRSAGFDRHLVKPVDLSALARLLDEVAARRRAH